MMAAQRGNGWQGPQDPVDGRPEVLEAIDDKEMAATWNCSSARQVFRERGGGGDIVTGPPGDPNTRLFPRTFMLTAQRR